MGCKGCRSEKLKDFTSEIAIHFPGWKGLDKPIVWVFPKLLVCLDCGFVEFVLPAEQLEQLHTDDSWPQSRKSARAS